MATNQANRSLLLKAAGLAMMIAVFASCKREYDPVPDHLDNIYPLTQGYTRVYYATDSNFSSTVEGGEGRTFLRKEFVDGTELDLLGRELTKLWTYESPDSVDSTGNRWYNFEFEELWTQYLDETYAERTEGNTRYVVLKVPPMKGTRWNGNMYNSDQPRTYEVMNHDTSVTVQGVTYDHCVYVLKVPYSVTVPNPFFYLREHAYEIYAPGIGKIVRHDERIEVQGNANEFYIPTTTSYYLHEELLFSF